MLDIEYILEKLRNAIYILVSGEGDARSRVGEAYYAFWHIKADDYPIQFRNNRNEIDRLLTRLPGRKGYIIADNLRKMKNKTASKIAVLILEIYTGLNESQRNT